MPSNDNPSSCCICGIALPNRYAVAGACEADGCGRPFCQLHWRRGNRRCREHGWRGQADNGPRQGGDLDETRSTNDIVPAAAPQPENEAMAAPDAQPAPAAAGRKLTAAKARQVMAETFRLVGRLGRGAAGLVASLKKDKSPEAMLATLEAGLANCAERRQGVAQRLEQQYALVAEKKKAHQTASPARRRIIEAELQTALAAYQATERQMQVLLENERVLAQVAGRVQEMMAYDMATVDQDAIDDLAVDLEDKIDSAEARLDAARDLERAGRRKDRESDRDTLWDELAAFDEPDAPQTAADREQADADLFAPVAEPPVKAASKPRIPDLEPPA